MLSGCVGYQEVQALPGWEKIYSPDRPQALEVPKGRVVPERPSVPVGRSGTRVLLQSGRHPREGEYWS